MVLRFSCAALHAAYSGVRSTVVRSPSDSRQEKAISHSTGVTYHQHFDEWSSSLRWRAPNRSDLARAGVPATSEHRLCSLGCGGDNRLQGFLIGHQQNATRCLSPNVSPCPRQGTSDQPPSDRRAPRTRRWVRHHILRSISRKRHRDRSLVRSLRNKRCYNTTRRWRSTTDGQSSQAGRQGSQQ